MKFTAIVFAAFAAGVVAQNGCGFPDGPICQSLGDGPNGLEQFADPDGCCLFPARCGNGDGGNVCERVSGAAAEGSANNNSNNQRGGSRGRTGNRKRM